MNILIPVSIGELIDKLSILEIKLDKIQQEYKKINLQKEFNLLNEYFLKLKSEFENIYYFYQKIKKINEQIWDLQEISKEKIENNNFDSEYLSITTKTHNLNDARFEVKKEINAKFNSELDEEKSYKKYQ